MSHTHVSKCFQCVKVSYKNVKAIYLLCVMNQQWYLQGKMLFITCENVLYENQKHQVGQNVQQIPQKNVKHF